MGEQARVPSPCCQKFISRPLNRPNIFKMISIIATGYYTGTSTWKTLTTSESESLTMVKLKLITPKRTGWWFQILVFLYLHPFLMGNDPISRTYFVRCGFVQPPTRKQSVQDGHVDFFYWLLPVHQFWPDWIPSILTKPFQKKKVRPSSLQTARLGDLRLQLDAEARISNHFLKDLGREIRPVIII